MGTVSNQNRRSGYDTFPFSGVRFGDAKLGIDSLQRPHEIFSIMKDVAPTNSRKML